MVPNDQFPIQEYQQQLDQEGINTAVKLWRETEGSETSAEVKAFANLLTEDEVTPQKDYALKLLVAISETDAFQRYIDPKTQSAARRKHRDAFRENGALVRQVHRELQNKLPSKHRDNIDLAIQIYTLTPIARIYVENKKKKTI